MGNFVLMRSSLRSIWLFLLLGISNFAFSQAQGFPKPKFTTSFSKTNGVKAGDEIEIIISFNVAKGFHVYSEKSDCSEFDGPIRATIDFTPSSEYKLIGQFYGVGDHMVKETEIWNCSTGEFTDRGEFRQKIKVLKSISSIEMLFNGQICNESGCENIRDVKILSPGLAVSGKVTDEPKEAVNKTAVNDAPEEAAQTEGSTDTTTSEKAIVDTQNKNELGYKNPEKLNGIKTFNGNTPEESKDDMWGLFILALLSGFTALLTPCVFPMIPMTVSFFIRNKVRAIALRDSFVFSISIIALYTIIGTLVAMLVGPDFANWLSTHWAPNLFFTVIFLVFAASFFGAFEITLPSWIVNKVDQQADKGGLMGPIFMAITIALVSFSCTGPIVGTVLVEAASGGAARPIVAMFGFSLAFALPFGLLALFPSWLNSLPKSGGWLNSVKVVLGFVEVAFALKFLSIPDQTYHWGILDREIYLAIWIVVFSLLGLYLMGKIHFDHDSTGDEKIGVFRLSLIITVFSFVVYMIPGMFGAPLKALAGYLPPMSTQDFRLDRQSESDAGICSNPKYSEYLHSPHGIRSYYDYDEAMACARQQGKPLFIDFTGHGCVNCRKMEEKVWADPQVLKMLKNDFVVVSLYVDDKKIMLPENEVYTSKSGKKIQRLGDKNADLEELYFGKLTQPLYCLLDGNEELVQEARGADYFQFEVEPFVEFLKKGLAEYQLRQNK